MTSKQWMERFIKAFDNAEYPDMMMPLLPPKRFKELYQEAFEFNKVRGITKEEIAALIFDLKAAYSTLEFDYKDPETIKYLKEMKD